MLSIATPWTENPWDETMADVLPSPKKPLRIDVMLRRVEEAVREYPKAALFELAEDGFGSPFEILVACILSIRTRDETTLKAAPRLFAVARTPEQVAALSVKEIDKLTYDCTFHEQKTPRILEIARRVVKEFDGHLPCDFEVLTSFKGVGPKCANLALGIACEQTAGVGVDVHVHRVVNRWGYVQAATPEKTMAALHEKLPRAHWVRINALLVPFGKHICTGARPRCSTCPVLDRCRQVGVVNPR
jgi:endonuclease-3